MDAVDCHIERCIEDYVFKVLRDNKEDENNLNEQGLDFR